jgi:hypothetical protein
VSSTDEKLQRIARAKLRAAHEMVVATVFIGRLTSHPACQP